MRVLPKTTNYTPVAACVDSIGAHDYDGPYMKEFWKNLRVSFFAGLLVVVPVAASVLILLGIFNWLTNFLLPKSLQSHGWTFLYRILALLIFVMFVSAIGWATRLMIGRRLLAVVERLLGRVPLLNKIYGFVKEVSQTMFSGRKTMFQRVVLIEFPRAGIYSIGFVTCETEGEIQSKTLDKVTSVFVPTTPNPTSGYLVMVPPHQIRNLEMTVAEGMKMVVSGGSVVPPYPVKPPQPPAPASR